MTRCFLWCIIALLFTSCKKTKNVSTQCSIYAYGLPKSSSGGFLPCSIGTINTSTATLTQFATLPGYLEKRCAFNSDDNCYYMYQDALYKIGQDGKTIALQTTDSIPFETMVYNSHNNKFYAIGLSLIELEVNGNKYTEKIVANFVHKYYYNTSLTVDNNGDIYCITRDKDSITHPYRTCYIEKYHPGSSTSTVVASDTSSARIFSIFGLAFNKNDNMLYAIRQTINPVATDFIRIDPSNGVITRLSGNFLNYFVDEYRYSVCIDLCTNHYILAQSQVGNTPTLDQIDMNGIVIQHNETDLIFMGLSVK